MLELYYNLLKGVKLLVIVSVLAGCGSKEEIVSIVALPKLVPPTINQAPNVKLTSVPRPQVVTLKQFEYFLEACNDWKAVGQDDAYTEEDLEIKYPGITMEDACNFAIYGLPTQEWLNLELDMVTASGAMQELRRLLENANRQLIEQYKIITEATNEIKGALENDN